MPSDSKKREEGLEKQEQTKKKLKLNELKVRTFLTDEEAEVVWGGTNPPGGGVTVGYTYTAAPPHCPFC